MFKHFFQRFQLFSSEETEEEEDRREERQRTTAQSAAGFAASDTARQSTQAANERFAKPDSYTGHRGLYDSGAAKRNLKTDAFNSGTPVYDPYTGKELVRTKAEAKARFGSQWAEHLAESDHITPLEHIHSDVKDNPWVTNEDISSAANSGENMRVTSRKFNNAKRSRSNSEFVSDREYLDKTGVPLTEEGRRQAIADERSSHAYLDRKMRSAQRDNLLKTGHNAGINGAVTAGATTLTMVGINNIVSVLNGDKSADEALEDTIAAGGRSAALGYVTNSSLTVACHQFSSSASPMIQKLVNSNVPGNVITAVMVTGETLTRFFSGEIDTQECLFQLGDRGLGCLSAYYSSAIGQTLIPIPVIGAAIGALVGSALSGELCQSLTTVLRQKQFEHEERLRIIAECQAAADAERAFRAQLQQDLDAYFSEMTQCFNDALGGLKCALQAGDANAAIRSANQITRRLGGEVHYETVKEFRDFLSDSSVDYI